MCVVAMIIPPSLLLQVMEKMVKWLLDQGASLLPRQDRGCDAFLLACKHNRVTIASLLLQRGATLHNYAMPQRWTPLMLAAEEGHVAMIHFLLNDCGGMKDQLDIQTYVDGTTALHRPCWEGYWKATKLLVDAGK